MVFVERTLSVILSSWAATTVTREGIGVPSRIQHTGSQPNELETNRHTTIMKTWAANQNQSITVYPGVLLVFLSSRGEQPAIR